jgi:hypothetical protein
MSFSVGQGALAGASVIGLGALAFYGLGMSNEVGAVDRAVVWPEHVRQRIRNTYRKTIINFDFQQIKGC